MTEQTKPPSRRVESDGFVFAQDGVEYHPHAGEWLEFCGRPSIGDSLRLMKVFGLVAELQGRSARELNKLPNEAIKRLTGDFEGAIAGTIDQLAKAITAWTWTDDSGAPYPSPPPAEVLRELSQEELNYLVSTFRGELPQDARKNGSSPSTSRSMGRKAAASRKSG